MSKERSSRSRYFDKRFCFVSYGVTIQLESDSWGLLDKGRDVVQKAFGGKAQIFEEQADRTGHSFGIDYSDGRFRLYKQGIEVSSGTSERNFFKFLNSSLRLKVAEFAEDRVFVHAGVIGWDRRALVMPGTSFAGKSTLTAELIKNGAEYYSDEYAVLEANGTVSPFPRHLSMRYFGATRETDVPAERLGGVEGNSAIPVGMVLFTSFTRGAEWMPHQLSPGAGVMELIPHTLTMRRDPAFSLKVLDLVARRAIMIRSPRGDVKKFAKFLLDFFDKHCK
jgi:hypothetical protein